MTILGVDPGREKVGLALIGPDGAVLWHQIVTPDSLRAGLPTGAIPADLAKIAVGDSTASAPTVAALERLKTLGLLPDVRIMVVNERGSTLEARPLYWEYHPPRGWRRLVPLSLQVPPEPIDDFAAAVVGRRGWLIGSQSGVVEP